MFTTSEGVRYYDASTLFAAVTDEQPHKDHASHDDQHSEVQRQQEQAACELKRIEHVKDEWQARTLSSSALNSAAVHHTLQCLRHGAVEGHDAHGHKGRHTTRREQQQQQGGPVRQRSGRHAEHSANTSTCSSATNNSSSSSGSVSSSEDDDARDDTHTTSHDALHRLFQQHLPPTLGVDIESVLVPLHHTIVAASQGRPQYEQLVCNKSVLVLLYTTIVRRTTTRATGSGDVREQHIVVFDEAGTIAVWDAVLAGHSYPAHKSTTTTSRSDTKAEEEGVHAVDELYQPVQSCCVAQDDRVDRLFLDPLGSVCVVCFASGKAVYLHISHRTAQAEQKEEKEDGRSNAAHITRSEVQQHNRETTKRRRGRRAWRWQPLRTPSHAQRETKAHEGTQPPEATPHFTSSSSSSSSAANVSVYSLCFTDSWSTEARRSTTAPPFVIDSVGWCTQPAAPFIHNKKDSDEDDTQTSNEAEGGVVALLGSRHGGCIASCVLSAQGVRSLRGLFVFPSPHATLPVQALAYHVWRTPVVEHKPADVLTASNDAKESTSVLAEHSRCVVLAALGHRLFVFSHTAGDARTTQGPPHPADAFRCVQVEQQRGEEEEDTKKDDDDARSSASSSSSAGSETTIDWLMCREYTKYDKTVNDANDDETEKDEKTMQEPIRPHVVHNYIELPVEAVQHPSYNTPQTAQGVALVNTIHIVTPRQAAHTKEEEQQPQHTSTLASDALRPSATLPAVFYWRCESLLVQGTLLHNGLDVNAQLRRLTSDSESSSNRKEAAMQTLNTLDKMVQPRVPEWEAFCSIMQRELQEGTHRCEAEKVHEQQDNDGKRKKTNKTKGNKAVCVLDTLLPIGLLSITDLTALACALQPGKDRKMTPNERERDAAREATRPLTGSTSCDAVLHGEWDEKTLECYRQLRAQLTHATSSSSSQPTARVSTTQPIAVHSLAPALTSLPMYASTTTHAEETMYSLAAHYDHIVLTTSSAVFVFAHLAALPLPRHARGWYNALLYRSKPYNNIHNSSTYNSNAFIVCADDAATAAVAMPNMFYALGRTVMVRLECTRQPGMLMQSVAQLLDAARSRCREDALTYDESDAEEMSSTPSVQSAIDVSAFALAPAPRLPTTLLHHYDDDDDEEDAKEGLHTFLQGNRGLQRLAHAVHCRNNDSNSNDKKEDKGSTAHRARAVVVPGFGVLPGQLALHPTASTQPLHTCITLYTNAYYTTDQLYEMALHASIHHGSNGSTTSSSLRERRRVWAEVRHEYGVYLIQQHRHLEASAQLARVVRDDSASEDFAEGVMHLVHAYKESGDVEPLVLFLVLRIRLLRQTLALGCTMRARLSAARKRALAEEHASLSHWLLTCLLALHHTAGSHRLTCNDDVDDIDDDGRRSKTCSDCDAKVHGRLEQLYRCLAAETPADAAQPVPEDEPYTASQLARSRVAYVRWKYHLHNPLALIEDVLLTLRLMSASHTVMPPYHDDDHDDRERSVCSVSQEMCHTLAELLCRGELGSTYEAVWMLELLGCYDRACELMLSRMPDEDAVMKVCARLELEYALRQGMYTGVESDAAHSAQPQPSSSSSSASSSLLLLSSVQVQLCSLQENNSNSSNDNNNKATLTRWLRARRDVVSAAAAAALWHRCAPAALRVCPVRFVTRGLLASVPAAVERTMSPTRLLPSLLRYTKADNELQSAVECSALDTLLGRSSTKQTPPPSQESAQVRASEQAAVLYLQHCVRDRECTPASLWWSLAYLLARDEVHSKKEERGGEEEEKEQQLIGCIQELAACAPHRLTYHTMDELHPLHTLHSDGASTRSDTDDTTRTALLCAIRRLCMTQYMCLHAAAWAAFYLNDLSSAVHEALALHHIDLASDFLRRHAQRTDKVAHAVVPDEHVKQLWGDVLRHVLRQHSSRRDVQQNSKAVEDTPDSLEAALRILDASHGVLDITDLVPLLDEKDTRLASLVECLPRKVRAVQEEMAGVHRSTQDMQRDLARLHKRQAKEKGLIASDPAQASSHMLELDAASDKCALCQRPLLSSEFVYYAHCGHALHIHCVTAVRRAQPDNTSRSAISGGDDEEEEEECVLCAGWRVGDALRAPLSARYSAADKALRDLLTLE